MASRPKVIETEEQCSSDSLRIDRCCDLARLSGSLVKTNPQVGAVLVGNKDNNIISENLHQFFGGPHAEINAMQSTDIQWFKGHSIYVSLEPCSHTGKTPPCVSSIIKHGFDRCVVGHRDPNPKVDGNGIRMLRQSGVEVREVQSKKADTILRPFIVNQTLHRPYIVLKWAQSADGFIGRMGQKVKISNALTSRLVHKWRSELQGIFVGTGTVINDNPHLGNRFYHGKNPIRITIDRRGRLGPEYKMLNGKTSTLVFTYSKRTGTDHIEYIRINEGQDELQQIFSALYAKNIGTLMIEGGAELLNSCIRGGFWDECRVISTDIALGDGILAPTLPEVECHQEYPIAGDTVRTFLRPF